MRHDDRGTSERQVTRPLAQQLRTRLIQFLRPFGQALALQLDIRLVQTAIDLVQVIITHRHRAMGLVLSELGAFLLGPQQAPAGTKRISNLLHAPNWNSDDINKVLWEQAASRVQALKQAS